MLDEDKKQLKRVDAYGKGLTDWEIEFVDSCLKQTDAGRELSEKQRAVIKRIDDHKVG